jgi:Cyclic nucleotide-binding domain
MFAEGQRVLRQGMQGGGPFIILDGEARVLIDGEERGRLGRGDFFGEIAALTGDAPTADVVATALLRCLTIPGPELKFQRLISWTKSQAPVERESLEYEWYDRNSLLGDEPDHRSLMPLFMDRSFDVPAREEMEAALRAFVGREPLGPGSSSSTETR